MQKTGSIVCSNSVECLFQVGYLIALIVAIILNHLNAATIQTYSRTTQKSWSNWTFQDLAANNWWPTAFKRWIVKSFSHNWHYTWAYNVDGIIGLNQLE